MSYLCRAALQAQIQLNRIGGGVPNRLTVQLQKKGDHVMTKKQMLEVELDMLENWVHDNIFEVSDDELNETLKDIEKKEKELKKEIESK